MSASASSSNIADQNGEDTDSEREYLHSPELVNKEKHVFILSTAGKPIYSRYRIKIFHTFLEQTIKKFALC